MPVQRFRPLPRSVLVLRYRTTRSLLGSFCTQMLLVFRTPWVASVWHFGANGGHFAVNADLTGCFVSPTPWDSSLKTKVPTALRCKGPRSLSRRPSLVNERTSVVEVEILQRLPSRRWGFDSYGTAMFAHRPIPSPFGVHVQTKPACPSGMKPRLGK